ncbi:aminotransferase class IV [Flavitalea flava]
MNELFTLINDDLLSETKAALLVSDLAIQRGYGIFDFFKTIGNKPIFLDDHLNRFYHSAGQLRLAVGKNRNELKAMLQLLMDKNQIPDSGIRMTLTGGYSPDGYALTQPNLIITQRPQSITSPEAFRKGTRLITYAHQRQMPETKTIDYLMAIWLQPLIREQKADDVLYHQAGIVTECPRSNFFMVTAEDELITPSRNILKGIIRSKLFELPGKPFQITERDISPEEIRTAKEAFITSTTKHILPVVSIDGQLIGGGEPGPVAQWLTKALGKLVKKI